jgi:hypothetical protein
MGDTPTHGVSAARLTEQQVRERAYYLWEAEGHPHRRAEIHWAMAEIATAVLSYLSLLEAEGTPGKRGENRRVKSYAGLSAYPL